jgi:HAD superfamily hydrolase (TIGR01549 family)
MPIRAIIFDIGGVLFRMQDFGPWRRWETRLGLPERRLGDIVFENPISFQAFVGEVTAAEAWNEAARTLDLTPEELEDLKADFWKGGVWDAELLDFIGRLKPNLKTGIISDAWDDTRQAIAEYVDDGTFDVIVISAEEGVAKPDPEIFRRALSRLGVAPHEAIFVDDRGKNVRGAQQLGMYAIKFTDTRAVMEGVEHILAGRAAAPS